MRKNSKTRFAALAMAFALIVTALPAAALAGDGNVIAFDGTGIVDTTETEYLAIAAGHPGDSISIYVPVKNVRITSYNVCYTKLLRKGSVDAVWKRGAAAEYHVGRCRLAPGGRVLTDRVVFDAVGVEVPDMQNAVILQFAFRKGVRSHE